jgi:hypothetical protein
MSYQEYNEGKPVTEQDTWPEIPTMKRRSIGHVEMGRRWSGYPFFIAGHAGGIGIALVVIGMWEIEPSVATVGAVIWALSFILVLTISWRRRRIDNRSINVQPYQRRS